MREQDGCDHDKATVDLGDSRSISMTIARDILALSSDRTQTANVQKPVCTEVARCDWAQGQAISRFSTLQKKLKNGRDTSPVPYEGLEKEIALFNLQSGELPSQLDRLQLDEQELVDLWENARKLENAIEEFEQEAIEEERDVYTWLRDKPKIDDVPKEAQKLESVKECANRTQDRAEQELRQEHDVSEKELRNRVGSKEETVLESEEETELESEQQEQEQKHTQTEPRRHDRR